MGRGRLLFPHNITIAQLDTAATESGPPGYDDIFKAPKLTTTADGIGIVGRKEKTPIIVPAQVEVDTFEDLNQLFSGNVPKTDVFLTFHYDDLIRLGLIETVAGREDREALKVNDRIVKIETLTGEGVFTPPNPPGLYIKELRPSGMMQRSNLIIAILEDREQGVTT